MGVIGVQLVELGKTEEFCEGTKESFFRFIYDNHIYIFKGLTLSY